MAVRRERSQGRPLCCSKFQWEKFGVGEQEVKVK